VLRFWESKFPQLKPTKRAGGRRYYRPVDMQLIGGIKRLLYDDGVTIKGVQKILKERGVKYVSSLSAPVEGAEAVTPDAAAVTANVVPLSTRPAPPAPEELPEREPAPEAPFIDIAEPEAPAPPTPLRPAVSPPAAVLTAIAQEDRNIRGLRAYLEANQPTDPAALRAALIQAITLREHLRAAPRP
ncbi:MAG: MerR family transcriptional regulator, partial [Shimia sp.]